jgi:hypothetical protein
MVTTNILMKKKMVGSRGLILTTVVVLVGPSIVFVSGTIRHA